MADARALIHGMLQVDPTQRLSIESILTHPWFKTTVIDKMPEQHGDAVSPGLTPHFDEPFARQGSTHLQIPSRGPSPLHQERVAPISEESDHSETSHLDSEHGKADTISTSATTASVGDSDEIHRVHSGEFSQTEKDLEMLHSNESQSTIRRIARGPLDAITSCPTLANAIPDKASISLLNTVTRAPALAPFHLGTMDHLAARRLHAEIECHPSRTLFDSIRKVPTRSARVDWIQCRPDHPFCPQQPMRLVRRGVVDAASQAGRAGRNRRGGECAPGSGAAQERTCSSICPRGEETIAKGPQP
jgi:serine/threonine protein kinase